MSYCLNPACAQPENSMQAELCVDCNSPLLLQGRYRVIKVLGQGEFGATFLATDESLPSNPYCAIKQLRPAMTDSPILPMARELFEREARTLGKIGNHPQVPRLLDYFEDHQQFYLVQEYISGLTLQQEIEQSGSLSEAEVMQFLSEILPVIQYIHSQQVIHRDIKPANMIRREQDRKLVLIDFGQVKDQVNQAAAANTSDRTALTKNAVGTLGFAPPEQLAMRPVYASDIYALGAACIYLLTRKLPEDLDYNLSTGEMDWWKYVQVSDHFANVLKKMLEASVRHRYQSAVEILRALGIMTDLDNLTQGLAVQLNAPSNSNTNSCGDLEFQSHLSSSSSATTKLREAIRSHRVRKEYSSSIFPNQQVSTSLRETQDVTKGQPQIPSKLDATRLLAAYQQGQRNFAYQDLNGLNFEKANLSRISFHQSNLAKTNLQEADLSGANLCQASLNRANLQAANLSRAYFSRANLEGADLRNADLSQANLEGADLRNADLSQANLEGANLYNTNLSNAKISGKQLTQAKTNWATVLPSGKRGFWLGQFS